MIRFEDLTGRLHIRDIRFLCKKCTGTSNNSQKEILFDCVCCGNERVAYNALWVFTHLPKEDKLCLMPRYDSLVDMLMQTSHTGHKRLLLTLLEELPIEKDDIRGDFLDFCMRNINSTQPYAIRALSLKLASRQCQFFPELLVELKGEMELMETGELSPGLRSAMRIVRRSNKQMCQEQQK